MQRSMLAKICYLEIPLTKSGSHAARRVAPRLRRNDQSRQLSCVFSPPMAEVAASVHRQQEPSTGSDSGSYLLVSVAYRLQSACRFPEVQPRKRAKTSSWGHVPSNSHLTYSDCGLALKPLDALSLSLSFSCVVGTLPSPSWIPRVMNFCISRPRLTLIEHTLAAGWTT